MARPADHIASDPLAGQGPTFKVEFRVDPKNGEIGATGFDMQARTGLAAWKRHAFVYAGNLDRAPRPLPHGEVQVQHVRIGPPGASPSGVPLDGLATDFDYADTYLNANVWHADAAKSVEYRAASEFMKQHYRKCAEIRVLSAAKEIIPPLRQWILDAQAAGHDL